MPMVEPSNHFSFRPFRLHRTERVFPRLKSTQQVVVEGIWRTPVVVLSWAILAFMPSVNNGWAWRSSSGAFLLLCTDYLLFGTWVGLD